MKDAKGHGSAAHQGGILQRVPNLVRAFAKDTSGEGKLPEFMEEPKTPDPESTGRLGAEVVGALAHHEVDPGILVHLVHFLAVLSSIAVIDILVRGLGWA